MTRRKWVALCKRHALRLMLAGTAIVALMSLMIFQGLLADLPAVTALELRTARPTTQILDRNGKLLYEVLDPDAGKQLDLTLSHMPRACVQATVATEDSRFFYHPGVDPLAIARAICLLYTSRCV